MPKMGIVLMLLLSFPLVLRAESYEALKTRGATDTLLKGTSGKAPEESRKFAAGVKGYVPSTGKP